jgi:hypothetical protein
MTKSRRQPAARERSALDAWVALAKTSRSDPIDEDVLDGLRYIAQQIERLLVTSCSVPAKQAAVLAAQAAGLTGRAIADFRAEQRAMLTTMAFEFNRAQPNPIKSTSVAGEIADVGERQVYKRRNRLR